MLFRIVASICVATLSGACSQRAEETPAAPVEPARDPQLSPAAQSAFKAWEARYDEARTLAASRNILTPMDELDVRVGVDQAGRIALSVFEEQGLSDADFAEANARAWEILSRDDADNTEFLKTILPPEGWFTLSQHGETAAANAFLIVQHSPDDAFRKSMLARMEPLLASGEVDRQHYALMFDRVAANDGRPQRYGTQGKCIDGSIQFSPIEDEMGLALRRSDMGLMPLEEYGRLIGVGNRC